nr:MAG TPA: holin [Caudoviricetes sp.]
MRMKRNVSIGTITRTAVLVLALVNQMLTVCGKSPLPWSSDEVANGVSMVLTAAVSIWAWWKNNSFTQAALAADEALTKQKGRGV